MPYLSLYVCEEEGVRCGSFFLNKNSRLTPNSLQRKTPAGG